MASRGSLVLYGFAIGFMPGLFLLSGRVASGEMNPIVALGIAVPGGLLLALASARWWDRVKESIIKWRR